ncbi:hypothetical protein [Phaeospirillum tilakii]|uniref:Uncharacterized protein n=1 Tax=Phaeospirillum tilakii TaxID=741673 RepID=A0ABW5CDU2_9PROT
MRVDPYCDASAPPPWPVTAGGGTLLIGPASEEAVRSGLSAPYCGFFECEGLPHRDQIESLLQASAREGGLVLSLTTRSAWRLDLTGLIAESLARRSGTSRLDQRRRIERDLSAAITQALVHDNLGLDSPPAHSLSGLLSHLDQAERRLRDPNIATRRLDLRILTEGNGRIEVLPPPGQLCRAPDSLFRRLARSVGRQGGPALPCLLNASLAG